MTEHRWCRGDVLERHMQKWLGEERVYPVDTHTLVYRGEAWSASPSLPGDAYVTNRPGPEQGSLKVIRLIAEGACLA